MVLNRHCSFALQIKPPNLRQRVPFEQTRVLIDEKLTVFDKKPSKHPHTSNGELNETDRLNRALVYNAQGLRLKENMTNESTSSSERAHLSPGTTHRFSFEFRIPSYGIPTSFDANKAVGCVRYSIQVYAQGIQQNAITHSLF